MLTRRIDVITIEGRIRMGLSQQVNEGKVAQEANGLVEPRLDASMRLLHGPLHSFGKSDSMNATLCLRQNNCPGVFSVVNGSFAATELPCAFCSFGRYVVTQ